MGYLQVLLSIFVDPLKLTLPYKVHYIMLSLDRFQYLDMSNEMGSAIIFKFDYKSKPVNFN
jgi:hypothetical protein